MKEIYDWVPWFRKLAENIAEGDEQDLIDKAKAVEWGTGSRALLEFDDEGIDPFSFFYFLASKNTKNQRPIVYPSVHETFNIKETRPDETQPDDCYIFPTPSSMATVLFHDGKTFHPNLLWSLFRRVVEDRPNIVPDDFRRVLDIKTVGVTKLTQTLFLINPKYFLPVDDTTGVVSEFILGSPINEVKEKIEHKGYESYQTVLDKLKNAFPGCQPYEINAFLWQQKKGQGITEDSPFFHVSTMTYDDGKDYWEKRDRSYKENNYVYTGGPGNKRRYPLTDPNPGDIILVRTGTKTGKAIGIVQKNDYASGGWEKNGAIHVLWINKSENSLSRVTEQMGFNQCNKSKKSNSTYLAFEETKGYEPTFKLIKSLASSNPNRETPNNQPSKPDVRKHSLNQILYGPPGTGKTWHTVNLAVAIAENKPLDDLKGEDREAVKQRFDDLKKQDQIAMVTFHQNFSYEDFIEGIRPVTDDESENTGIKYELSQGIFKEIAERASNNREKNYVLIIDEINRGNIAKIFGELITLIEPSKRLGGADEATVILPYSEESFGVPDNLYIIGTMNTADRSIALLDTALRRRFEFVEMMPNPSHSDISTNIDGVNCQELLKAMNKRITILLDREHQIGHTYFLDVENIDSLEQTFKNKIIPLLQEYFYDNWEKIDAVLNKNGFIREISFEDGLLRDSDLIDEQKKVYELLPDKDDAWGKAEYYENIYQKNQEASKKSG